MQPIIAVTGAVVAAVADVDTAPLIIAI